MAEEREREGGGRVGGAGGGGRKRGCFWLSLGDQFSYLFSAAVCEGSDLIPRCNVAQAWGEEEEVEGEEEEEEVGGCGGGEGGEEEERKEEETEEEEIEIQIEGWVGASWKRGMKRW